MGSTHGYVMSMRGEPCVRYAIGSTQAGFQLDLD